MLLFFNALLPQKGVIDHLSGCQPFGWVPLQALRNEAEGVARTVGNDSREAQFRVLGNSDSFELSLLRSLRPRGCRGAEDRGDFADLVELRGPQEERLSEVHLGYDAPDRKGVDRRRVGRELEEHFGRPVPPRRDVLGVRRFAPDFPGDTEVDDLDGEVGRNQQVLGFEVAVEEALSVDVLKGLCQLTGDVPYFALSQPLPRFLAVGHQAVEVPFDVLEDEVGFVDDPDDFLEADDVGVLHLPEGLDLRELEALFPGPVLLLEALDGDDLSRFPVLRHFDVAERPGSQLLCHPVLLHYYLKSTVYYSQSQAKTLRPAIIQPNHFYFRSLKLQMQ